MISVIETLMRSHGIAAANISIKPHGDTVAAVINLIPDAKAVSTDEARAAISTPIVLIGSEAISNANAEAILGQVEAAMGASEYFNAQAMTERLKAVKSTTKPAANTPKATAPKKAEPAAPAAPTAPAGDIFAMDSL